MPTDFPTVPAVYTGKSIGPRHVFLSGRPSFLPSLATIDGTKTRDTGNDIVAHVRAGTLMGKVTSGGKWRNSVIGLVGSAYASGTSMTVAAAVATEVARLITLAGGNVTLKVTGPPAAAGVVSATSVTCSAASGTTLTIVDPGVAKAAGSLIGTADGSETPVQLIAQPYGVDVTDTNGTSQDATMDLVRGGDVDVSMIPFYSSMDASVKTWVKAALKGAGMFTFSDDSNR